MRPIVIAHLDKARPVVVLTREGVRERLVNVTVAYITSTVKGLSTELAVGTRNGLDRKSVVSLDNVTTIPTEMLGRQIGWLLPDQEAPLAECVRAAFDIAG
ncbi:MAG: type II toxin-antitoxin system PemK/MazF family toxin [Dermatophilaceae bacterium]